MKDSGPICFKIYDYLLMNMTFNETEIEILILNLSNKLQFDCFLIFNRRAMISHCGETRIA